MTIAAAAKGTPIPKPSEITPFVDVNTGALTMHGLQLLSAWREFIVGMNRIIPCNATGTNLISLAPITGAAPLLEKYVDYEIFSFVAANTSTGAVTATVVPRIGTLATIKVYVNTTQAAAGDVVQNRTYLAIYNDALDSAAGGLVLK